MCIRDSPKTAQGPSQCLRPPTTRATPWRCHALQHACICVLCPWAGKARERAFQICLLYTSPSPRD
eukprot:10987340-Alexandrium_andersonii.AAC.1